MSDHQKYRPRSVSFTIHAIAVDQDTALDRMESVVRSLRRGTWPNPLPNGITLRKNHGGGGPGEGNQPIKVEVPTALDVDDLPDDHDDDD